MSYRTIHSSEPSFIQRENIASLFGIPSETRDILIADAGGTSTDWLFLSEALPEPQRFRTKGMNPNAYDNAHLRHEADTAATSIAGKLTKCPDYKPALAIAFYGAGCSGAGAERIRTALEKVFPHNIYIVVGSDLELAAHALFGTGCGTACILGTGANSGFWNGKRFTAHTPPLGYILGDEGSGADLGRELLRRSLRGELPEDILYEMKMSGYSTTEDEAIKNVYRQPGAAAYLASFVPFIASHCDIPTVSHFVEERLRLFLMRHVYPYGEQARTAPVGFIGGVAYALEPLLHNALEAEGFTAGRIMQSPLDAFC